MAVLVSTKPAAARRNRDTASARKTTMSEFSWIYDDDAQITHKRRIDSGAFGDVHEASFPFSQSNVQLSNRTQVSIALANIKSNNLSGICKESDSTRGVFECERDTERSTCSEQVVFGECGTRERRCRL